MSVLIGQEHPESSFIYSHVVCTRFHNMAAGPLLVKEWVFQLYILKSFIKEI
jgi:hypothetical protein